MRNPNLRYSERRKLVAASSWLVVDREKHCPFWLVDEAFWLMIRFLPITGDISRLYQLILLSVYHYSKFARDRTKGE